MVIVTRDEHEWTSYARYEYYCVDITVFTAVGQLLRVRLRLFSKGESFVGIHSWHLGRSVIVIGLNADLSLAFYLKREGDRGVWSCRFNFVEKAQTTQAGTSTKQFLLHLPTAASMKK
jgi:hypothetical protein